MLFRDVSLGEGEGAVADALKPLALAASRAKA
jgi:hypothetical protein